ncbi:cyclin-like protein [Colletotrichum somersetense]|nr:cyclin-like protein [Colletotrichum somersetense]
MSRAKTLERQALEEYDEEIFEHLLDIEVKLLPLPNYMESQMELNWGDRAELIEKFFSWSKKSSITAEPVFLALNFVDRFLSYNDTSGHLEALGAVAFALALKYEIPDVHDRAETCPSVINDLGGWEKGYKSSDISSMEARLLKVLDHSLGIPSPFLFMRRIRSLDKSRQPVLRLAQYFAAGTMLMEQLVGTKPSLIAAASYFLSLILLNYDNKCCSRPISTLQWVSKVSQGTETS